MAELNCPSCGAALPMRSAAMPYVVCAFCQSVVLREGEDLKLVGKSAVLPFDVSPLMLGTQGKAGGVGFTIIGRVRWGWTDGSWNEWLLACDDGQSRWLGEAMGQYMFLTERPDVLENPLAKRFARGGELAIADEIGQFRLIDIKTATCLGGEGDLPFPTPTDWTMTSLDFRDADGNALNLQRDRDGTHAYEGRYYSLSDLSPRGLRRIEGWSIPGGMA